DVVDRGLLGGEPFQLPVLPFAGHGKGRGDPGEVFAAVLQVQAQRWVRLGGLGFSHGVLPPACRGMGRQWTIAAGGGSAQRWVRNGPIAARHPYAGGRYGSVCARVSTAWVQCIDACDTTGAAVLARAR